MERIELAVFLDFIREKTTALDAQIKIMEGDNWNKTVRGDDDKEVLYWGLHNLRNSYQNLLRREYRYES